MKIKALALAALLVAGVGASFAIAKSKPQEPGASTATSSTSHKPKCNQVELKGNTGTGSVTFTVKRANRRGHNLVGTQVTLSVPAGAKVIAKACSAGTTLTLRDLDVEASPAKH